MPLAAPYPLHRHVAVPADDRPPDGAPLPLGSDALGARPEAPSLKTILIAEDDGHLRKVICRSLTRAGYRVIVVSDAEEALRVVSTTSAEIDLVLTDLVLPGMSGRDLAAKVGLVRPGTRVLIMSGYLEDAIVDLAALGPCVSFLPKPFSHRDLLRRVEASLRPG